MCFDCPRVYAASYDDLRGFVLATLIGRESQFQAQAVTTDFRD